MKHAIPMALWLAFLSFAVEVRGAALIAACGGNANVDRLPTLASGCILAEPLSTEQIECNTMAGATGTFTAVTCADGAEPFGWSQCIESVSTHAWCCPDGILPPDGGG